VSTRGVPEDEVEVTVKDAGEGLSEDELEQVFNAFFSTKQEKVAMTAEQNLVYIVDDEPVIRDALSLLAEDMGLPARCFSSACEFIDFC